MEFIYGLFFLVLCALIGGIIARLTRIPLIVGYVISGLIFAYFLPQDSHEVAKLSEIGTILLLFTIGLELSLNKISRFIKVAVLGATVQIVLITGAFFGILVAMGMDYLFSFILAFGISLSSTAVVVKILQDRREFDTIHGNLMFGWLLMQDLAVIPLMVVLPFLAQGAGGSSGVIFGMIGKSIAIIALIYFAGKYLVPYFIHKVSATNSRELLMITSLTMALGVAAITSYFGVSASLGAFLAGFVISETMEHHAILTEIRPLRDLFLAVFFVSLGFLIIPAVVASNLVLIIGSAVVVIVIKTLIVFLVSVLFGFKGKTAVLSAIGLSQVGEFAFVLYAFSSNLGLLSPNGVSIGIAIVITTLIISPLIYMKSEQIWDYIKKLSKERPFLNKLFRSRQHIYFEDIEFKDHIIICGFGRVGSWIGKALENSKIKYVVVEYNQSIVNDLKRKGDNVLYGDPSDPDLLELVDIRNARAIVLTIPDRGTQESLIAYVQTVAPNVKIFSRIHDEDDYERIKLYNINKIIQPEFEAAVSLTKNVLTTLGHKKENIISVLKGMRVSRGK